MDGIREINPNGKLIGIMNATMQHEKQNQKKLESIDTETNSLSSKKISSNSIQNDLEMTIEYNGKKVKATYTKEDLLKNVVSINDESIPQNKQSFIQLNLDLKSIIDEELSSPSIDEIAATDVATKATGVKDSKSVIQSPSLNPLQVELLTADSLEMNVFVQIGNDKIMVGNNSTATFNMNVDEDNGEDVFVIGNNSNVNIDSTVKVDNSDDILIVGNNSQVNIKTTTGVDNGNDVMIIGNNSKVSYSGASGTDNGNDTIIMGNNSELIIEGNTGTNDGNSTIILGNNSRLVLSGASNDNNTNSNIIIGNGVELYFKSSNIENRDLSIKSNHHLKLNISIDLSDDKDSWSIITGKDIEELLNKLKDLGNKLDKYRIKGKPVKSFLDKTMEDIEKFLQKNSKYNSIFGSNNKQGTTMIRMSMYNQFYKQFAGIDMMYSFANEQYKKNKIN